MINLKKYVLNIIYRVKTKPKIDIDFWEDIYLIDLEECKNV